MAVEPLPKLNAILAKEQLEMPSPALTDLHWAYRDIDATRRLLALRSHGDMG